MTLPEPDRVTHHRPSERYQALLESGRYLADPVQAAAIDALDSVYDELVTATARPWWRRWKRSDPVRGLYLWGSVGRGKTWMMDLFFDALPMAQKQRFHFHRFMARVHDELRARASDRDPLPEIARDWAARCRVLCFDEFFVSDIADAMLLGGLLDALFDRGVTLVATSNSPPQALYRDGLQRRRFLPAIELLKQHTLVLHVGGETDYRLRLLERSPTYHHPLDAAAESALEDSFRRMAGDCVLDAYLTLNRRAVPARQRGDGIIWFDFEVLCETPRSTADYIEIARAFNTVLLSGVPVMGPNASDAARRFVNLVDEFYDRNVKLLLSAEVPPERLYTGQRLAFEFERTASRLVEMQSHDYLARPHLP